MHHSLLKNEIQIFFHSALVEKKTCRSFLSELSYGHNVCDSIEMFR